MYRGHRRLIEKHVEIRLPSPRDTTIIQPAMEDAALRGSTAVLTYMDMTADAHVHTDLHAAPNIYLH